MSSHSAIVSGIHHTSLCRVGSYGDYMYRVCRAAYKSAIALSGVCVTLQCTESLSIKVVDVFVLVF